MPPTNVIASSPKLELVGMLAARPFNADQWSVKRWFQSREVALGCCFVPQSMALGIAAIQLATTGQDESATAELDRLETLYPDRPETVAYRAIALARTGQPDAAIEAIDRAIYAGERVDHPASRMASFRIFREAIERQR